ncbi:MAG: hypothetical protein ACREBA_02390 [Nitrosotalea sp.]
MSLPRWLGNGRRAAKGRDMAAYHKEATATSTASYKDSLQASQE